MTTEEARKQGAVARYEGFRLRDNPYGVTPLRRAWEDGWRRWTDVVKPEDA